MDEDQGDTTIRTDSMVTAHRKGKTMTETNEQLSDDLQTMTEKADALTVELGERNDQIMDLKFALEKIETECRHTLKLIT